MGVSWDGGDPRADLRHLLAGADTATYGDCGPLASGHTIDDLAVGQQVRRDGWSWLYTPLIRAMADEDEVARQSTIRRVRVDGRMIVREVGPAGAWEEWKAKFDRMHGGGGD